ncbi:hypothetical protein [Halorhabdus rudnickae]|uniref:hypothetical protein n=1 Tax=Halorhabdus rudnickae TaxID=1775544 RepID=UPI0010839D15|nr:hypothetical protein [Halorhabdus rudnickae]
MAGELHDDEQGYEQHKQAVSESVDGGGCAETWEALSEKRARTEETADNRHRDVERTLVDIECLQFTADGDDFELVPSFQTAWRTAIDELDDANPEAVIADVFAVDGTVRIETDDQVVHARQDGQLVGQWVSRPAMVADLGACRVFEQRDDDWTERSPVERSQFAGSVRLYLEFCPDCGGQASFDTETVTSCCNEYEVATVSCEGCEATLLEIPVFSDRA